jgi:hypothetical protein
VSPPGVCLVSPMGARPGRQCGGTSSVGCSCELAGTYAGTLLHYRALVTIINPVDDRELGAAEPLLFIAGPVQGAPDYQMEFARVVLDRRPDFVVATPRVPAELDRQTFNYDNQVDWEERHLWRAAQLGGVAFWFAAQDPALPHRPGRAYAQTTRIEIGKIVGWRRFMPLNLAVGFDADYAGGSQRYIRRMLHRDSIAVATGMEEFIEHLDQHILRQCPASADGHCAAPAPG